MSWSENRIEASGDIVVSVIGNDNNISIQCGKNRLSIETIRHRLFMAKREFTENQLPILKPDAGLTSFVGRDEMLEEFVNWAEDRSKGFLSIRTVCGRGGAGKTRFALELIKQLEHNSGYDYAIANEKIPENHWVAGFIRGDQLDQLDAFKVKECLRWPNPSLLVIDYVGAHSTGIKTFLSSLQKNLPDDARVRILLLERTADPEQGWAKHVRAGLENQWDEIYELAPVDISSRMEILREAITKLAAKKVMQIPDIDTNRQALYSALEEEQWSSPLLLMMAASEALETSTNVVSILTLPRTELIEKLAGREMLRVTADEDEAELSVEQKNLLALTVCATLARGLSQDQIEILLGEICQQSSLSPHQYHTKLKNLFYHNKKEHSHKTGFVEPDIIGEEFIFLALKSLYGNNYMDAEHARKTYEVSGKTVIETLVRMINDFYHTREKDSPGHAALQWLHRLQPEFKVANLAALMDIANAMPQYSTALIEYSCQLEHGICTLLARVAKDKPEEIAPYLASSYHNLANRLSDLGDREGAKEYAVKAVDLYAELSALNPQAFRPYLVSSYHNLANSLSDLGDREGAKEYAEKAVDLYAELSALNPQAFRPYLASSYHNLANRLSDLGDREGAKEYAEKAVDLYAELSALNPQAFRPDLASSYHNLANSLSDLGDREGAKEYAEKAVDLYAELSALNPQAFRPYLASSYNNLANRLSDLGDRECAKEYAEKAVDLYAELSALNPQAFRPDLASSYHNLANRLSDLGDREGAKEYAEKAVDLYTELFALNPQAFRPDLASSYHNLANRLSDLGDREGAKEYAGKAVDLYTELSALNPQAFRPDLASSYNNLGSFLSDLGDREGAKEYAEKAVKIREELSALNPQAFRPDLASSYHNLANRLSDLGDREGAKEYAEKAVDLYTELSALNPQAFRPDLASSYNNLGSFLSDLGDREGAKEYAEKAVDLYTELSALNPQAFTPDLAMSLETLYSIQYDLGFVNAAFETVSTAITKLAPFFIKIPMAHSGLMSVLIQDYAKLCENRGIKPDNELLDPILKVLNEINSNDNSD